MATRKKVKYKGSIINLAGSPSAKKPPRKTTEYKGRTFHLPEPLRGRNNEDDASEFYIWRTQRDSKARSSHAEREGKIFRWDDPPEGGHPGEDSNCRCWAEEISSETELPDVDEH